MAGCLVGRVAGWQVGWLAGWLVDKLASLPAGKLAIQYNTIQYNYIIIILRCARPADPGFLTLNVFDSGHDASSDWSVLSSNAARIWAQGLGLLGSIWASWAPFFAEGLVSMEAQKSPRCLFCRGFGEYGGAKITQMLVLPRVR